MSANAVSFASVGDGATVESAAEARRIAIRTYHPTYRFRKKIAAMGSVDERVEPKSALSLRAGGS